MNDIEKAVELLNKAEVVGIPTETVYGLAARANLPQGIRKIFETKMRPFFDPLIVHVADKEMARFYVDEWNDIADFLSEQFWPGPLTLVLRKSVAVHPMISSGLSTVGIRCPRNQKTLEIIRRVGVGLPAPSANIFSKTSPTRWEHVQAEFAGKVFVVKHDPSEIGIESTVLRIEATNIQILRKGAISGVQIEDALKRQGIRFEWSQFQDNSIDSPSSPGQLMQHYQPKIPLKLFSLNEASVEGGFEIALPLDSAVAARELYHSLRVAGDSSANFLYLRVRPEMLDNSWEAIRDRLAKASSWIDPVLVSYFAKK